jgi:hypothetical protein
MEDWLAAEAEIRQKTPTEDERADA